MCGAVLFGVGLGVAGPASADPSVFGVLSCGCHDVAPANSPVPTDRVNEGIRQGLAGPASTPVQ
ncbi:hypothetical protein MSAS_47610 [Mycobacterium saskatchewanense]|nr:hypothetical protein MSAS_47610 [Mycobacterium saskatchewanense]